MWGPCHKDIPLNEVDKCLVCNGTYFTRTFNWVLGRSCHRHEVLDDYLDGVTALGRPIPTFSGWISQILHCVCSAVSSSTSSCSALSTARKELFYCLRLVWTSCPLMWKSLLPLSSLAHASYVLILLRDCSRIIISESVWIIHLSRSIYSRVVKAEPPVAWHKSQAACQPTNALSVSMKRL